MATVEQYYQILGVGPNATVKEIVRAYHKKAMQLHPDRNKTPNATQQFILLEEAYKYLRNLKEGKITTSGNAQFDEFAKWWAREQANTRQRAQERARMRYEEYINTEEYKMETAADHVANVFFATVTFCLLVVLPLYLCLNYGQTGIFSSIFIAIVTLPFTAPVLAQPKMLRESVKQFLPSATYFFGYKWAQQLADARQQSTFIFGTINAVIITQVVANTVLPDTILIGSYTAAVAIGYIIPLLRGIKNERKHQFYAFYLAPTIVSALFAINFIFSSSPHIESYKYDYHKDHIIRLDNNAYKRHTVLRFFPVTRNIMHANHIKFTFEKGLFGIRVMKDYKLDWEYDDETDY